MARNNISLSVTPKDPPKGYEGPWKIRWREDVITDGVTERRDRSRSVSDKGARDALVGKLRRTLETGEVFTPAARVVTTPGNLELAALAWLRWQASRDRKRTTLLKYKCAIARIMGTIRRVRGVKADAAIPVTVLDVQLFVDLRNVWIAEDVAATRARKASPMRRYHLSGFLFAVWSFAASQPAAYACVPALVDSGLVIPPVPAQPGAPPAPSWAECDCIIRRAYIESEDLGDILASERLTGLRVDQVASIRRRAIDTVACTLVVEVGKGKQEVADKRTIPVPQSLIELWQPRIKACSSPNDYLFPAPGRESGHMEPETDKIAGFWLDAEKAGEVRMHLYKPLTSRKGRPNHAFRAAYMAGLEAITVEVDGAPVQRVKDRTIDFLVAHRPMDTRSRHYTPPSWPMLVAAVGFVAPLDLVGDQAAAPENVVAGPW